LCYKSPGSNLFLGPFADQRRRIRLFREGNPKFHALTSQPWILYSFIRQWIPGHSRIYYCFGENEKGRAFVARISLGLWRAFTLRGEKAFLSMLKPTTVRELEKKLRRRAERTGNLWTLQLPTDLTELREWAIRTLGWDLVPRSRKNSRLLGRSGWFIRSGFCARPWSRGESIAVAGGEISSPVLCQYLRLYGPHLVGTTHGWEYY
jgi:hypothetical protein